MRIVYLSWPAHEVSGGIKMAYRHVETLQAAGLASVVATLDGQPPSWFATRAATVGIDDVRPGDALVFPENHPQLLGRFANAPQRKVVLCQNAFMIFRGLADRRSYADYGVTDLLTVGAQTSNVCRLRFPELRVTEIPVVIDFERFVFTTTKKRQIAFAPRKRPLEAQCIRDLFLSLAPRQAHWPWIEIQGLPEARVAEILAESAVYLSLCRFEACPLSILEALACGCVVAGFTGQGGDDFATASNGLWASEDDCLACAQRLAEAVGLIESHPDAHANLVAAGAHTARRYHAAAFEARLLRFWREF